MKLDKPRGGANPKRFKTPALANLAHVFDISPVAKHQKTLNLQTMEHERESRFQHWWSFNALVVSVVRHDACNFFPSSKRKVKGPTFFLTSTRGGNCFWYMYF